MITEPNYLVQSRKLQNKIKKHFETVGVGGFSVNLSTVTELAQFYPCG